MTSVIRKSSEQIPKNFPELLLSYSNGRVHVGDTQSDFQLSSCTWRSTLGLSTLIFPKIKDQQL